MITVQPGDEILRELAYEAARRHDTLGRAVHLRLLLHLPRLASPTGLVPDSWAIAEADRLAARLPHRHEWTLTPGLKLEELDFAPVSGSEAATVCERFHYLSSARSDARSHGLVDANRKLVALAVTTACDVDRLRQCALDHLGDPNPRVLARVFSFEGAPPNALTRLFKLVSRAEHEHGTRSMVTYVNPNMGFTGASYRAGNWTVIGKEPGTTYRYLDCDYVTDRELARQIGRAKIDDTVLVRRFGARYQRSHMHLAPLQIHGRAV